ncbi:hypothetical protein PR202_gb19480 [Eleusine coracana subsp. coracana]|uniref:Elongation factor 2 n=1 Tax=Eleusine coracana subsp. coracana TaxID=191504 RepID=A0AAV5F8D3_ELECO|nr:hypothetical protein PR202_gb19480 [Eleusine coracana subsp. coracana]
MDESDLRMKMWGDNFYDKTSKQWFTKHNGSKQCVRGFVWFCYNPMKMIIHLCLNDQKESLWHKLGNLGVTLKNDEKELTGEALMKCVMHNWLQAGSSLFEMTVYHLPSPSKAQRHRVENLYEGPLLDKYNCNWQEGPCDGSQLCSREEGKSLCEQCEGTVICMGQKKQYFVEDIPCGNTVALVGLDKFITNSATVTNENEIDACPIRAMKLLINPLVCVGVNCERSDLPKLKEGLKFLEKSDPTVICNISESGGYIAGAGELHLKICLSNLVAFMDQTQVTSSAFGALFRETVVDTSSSPISYQFVNRFNQIYMKALPLEEDMLQAIDNGRIDPHADLEVRSKILSKDFGWDRDVAKKIWSFGPKATGPNVVVDMCEEEKNEIKGFYRGWLPVGIRKRGANEEIIQAARVAAHNSQLAATPRLLEPIYLVEIEAPEDLLNAVKVALYKQRGSVFKDIKINRPGNKLYKKNHSLSRC